MIAHLTGKIGLIESDRCVVDVAGVGYLVMASTRTLAALPSDGVATVLTEMQVREDAITLFGFCDTAERDWFRLLTTVQGVGARVALNILSAVSPQDLVQAIQAGDRSALTRASGVGAKLAIRLLTELRDRAGAMATASGLAAIAAAPQTGVEADALSALANLGYRRAEAWPVVTRVAERLGQDAAAGAVIHEALRELARQT